MHENTKINNHFDHHVNSFERSSEINKNWNWNCLWVTADPQSSLCAVIGSYRKVYKLKIFIQLFINIFSNMLMRDERKKVHNYQLSVGFFDWVVAAAHSRETWKVLDCREPLSPPPTPPNQILEPGWGASIAALWAVNDTGQPVQSPRGGHLRAFSCGELLELRDYQDTKRRRRLSFSRLSRTYFCFITCTRLYKGNKWNKSDMYRRMTFDLWSRSIYETDMFLC